MLAAVAKAAWLPAPRQRGRGRSPDTRYLGPLAIAVAAAVLVALGLGWFIAGRFLRPLRTITATARDISATNLSRRLGLGSRDEFAALGATLDELFGRLETSFESQRHFVANASHELRTPLAAERTLLQVALADPDASAQTLLMSRSSVRSCEAALRSPCYALTKAIFPVTTTSGGT